MQMVVVCVGCGKRYAVGEQLAGRRVRCRNCGNILIVPGRTQLPKVAAASPPVKLPTSPPTVVPAPAHTLMLPISYAPVSHRQSGGPRYILMSLSVVGLIILVSIVGFVIGKSRWTGAPNPPPSDLVADRLRAFTSDADRLMKVAADSDSREKMLGQLSQLRSSASVHKADLEARGEWTSLESLFDAVEKRFRTFSSELPDDSLYRDPPPGAIWAASLEHNSQLGEEVSFRGFKFRPPLEVALDLGTSEGDAAGLTWNHRKLPAMRVGVRVVPRTDAKQRRPWVATRRFVLEAATRANLFVVDAVTAEVEVTYGRINGLAFTRIASEATSDPGGERWITYIALDGNFWLVINLHSRDIQALMLLDSCARTIRPATGEPKADPFAPHLIASRLADDPAAASAILRRQGAAAEAAVVAQLQSPDILARREAAKLLGEVATAASVPALQKAAASNDPEVAKAASAVLRRIAPEKPAPAATRPMTRPAPRSATKPGA